jgi:hypothetical protein
MEPISNLPRPIQVIIEENTPRAVKSFQAWKSKQRSTATLQNHLDSKTVPRSLNIKTTLIVPDCLEKDPEDVSKNQESINNFKAALDAFKLAATLEMFNISNRATLRLERDLQELILSVDQEIINFQYQLIQVLHPTEAEAFNNAMKAYPGNIGTTNPYIAETLSYIERWKQYYQTTLTSKIANEVAARISKDKKIAAKLSAEEMIMDDTNNELVRDLIRKELKPLRDTVQSLNIRKAEAGSSAKKQKNSTKNSAKDSKISWEKGSSVEGSIASSRSRTKKGNRGRSPHKKEKEKKKEISYPKGILKSTGRESRSKSPTKKREQRRSGTPPSWRGKKSNK